MKEHAAITEDLAVGEAEKTSHVTANASRDPVPVAKEHSEHLLPHQSANVVDLHAADAENGDISNKHVQKNAEISKLSSLFF